MAIIEKATEANSQSTTSTKEFVKLKRTPEEKQPWEDFFGQQRIEGYDTKSTDCNLICSDGIVPAHTLVLQAVSPFFDAIFAAQGCPCLTSRPITMEDYSVTDVRKLIELVYTGSVIVKSEQQMETLKCLVKTFQILTFAPLECTNVEPVKSGRGRPTQGKDHKEALFYPFDKQKTVKDNMDMILSKIKPVVPLIKANVTKTNAAIKTATAMTTSMPAPTTVKKFHPPATHDSDSDSADEREQASASSEEWFQQEAKRCQYCNVACKTAAAASACLTSHNRLRCYFCFKVVRNTEKLFQHFSDKHKKAGRENCLLCPICETIVPFKSVSCHVISQHLSDNKNSPSKTGMNRPGRPPASGTGTGPPNSTATATNAAPKPAVSPSKQAKTNEQTTSSSTSRKRGRDPEPEDQEEDDDASKKKKYALTDLKITFRKHSICGKVRVFDITKARCPQQS